MYALQHRSPLLRIPREGVQKDAQEAVHYCQRSQDGPSEDETPAASTQYNKTHALRACPRSIALVLDAELVSLLHLCSTPGDGCPSPAGAICPKRLSPPHSHQSLLPRPACRPSTAGASSREHAALGGCPWRGAQAPIDANLWRRQRSHVAAPQLLRPRRPSRPAGCLVSRDLSSLPSSWHPSKEPERRRRRQAPRGGKRHFANAQERPRILAPQLRRCVTPGTHHDEELEVLGQHLESRVRGAKSHRV